MPVSRSASFTVRHRPYRIGFCVRSDSLDDVCASAQLATAVWGGMYCFLVPLDRLRTRGYSIARDLGLDLLYAPGGNDLIDGLCPHLSARGLGALMVFREFADEGVYPQTLDVLPYIEHLWSTVFRTGADSSCAHVEWEDDDPQSALLSVEFGTYAGPQKLATDYGGAFLRGLRARALTLSDSDDVPAELASRVSPILLTGGLLHLDSMSVDPENPMAMVGGGFFVGDPNCPADLCDYWNVRAHGTFAAFLPIAGAGRWSTYLAAAAQKFERVSSVRFGGDEKPASSLWIPARLRGRESEAMAAARAMCDSVTYYVRHPYRQPGDRPSRAVSFSPRTVIGAADPVESSRNTWTARVPLPAPPVEGISAQGLNLRQWLVSVDRLRWHEASAPCVPPHVPALNRELSEAMLHWGGVRSDAWGIGLPCRPDTDVIAFRSIAPMHYAELLLSKAGISASLSHQGKLAQRLIDGMGGLASCRLLKIPGLRDLLRSLSESKTLSKKQLCDRIWRRRRGVPELDGFTHAVVEPNTGERPQVDDVLSYMVRCGLLMPGVRPDCERCGLRPWVPLDRVSEKATCEYCGERMLLSVQTTDRRGLRWEYRRSGVFGRRGQAEDALPVALALHHLEMSCRGQQLLLPCLDLVDDESGSKIEVDLLSVTTDSDGQTSVIVGECKTSDSVDADALQVRATLLERIRAALSVPTYLLIAKDATGLKRDEVERYRAFAEDAGLIVWTRDELESSQLPVGGGSASVRDLVTHTAKRYLETP